MNNKEINNNLGKEWLVFSELTKDSVETLKKYREMLWECSVKGTTGFLVEYFKNIFSVKDSVEKMKDYISDEDYNLYLKEYNMTIVLLDKCLAKAKKDNLYLPTQDGQLIDQIMSKISIDEEKISNKDEILSYLKEEDSTTRKKLQDMGLDESFIKLAIDKGFTANSVLETETDILHTK